MKTTSFLLTLALLLAPTLLTKIQCEFTPEGSTWVRNKELSLSKHETIVSSLYDKIDLIVDPVDQTVSK